MNAEEKLFWVLARQLQVGQMFGQWRCNWYDSKGNAQTQMDWYPDPMSALDAAIEADRKEQEGKDDQN